MTDTEQQAPKTYKPASRQTGALIVLSVGLFLGIILIGVVMINQLMGTNNPPIPTVDVLRPTNTPDLGTTINIIPIANAEPLSNLTLVGDDGTPFEMWNDLNGKYVLVYFGYTNCPDYCPLTLAEFTQIKRQLGTLADQFEFVMVSIDPDRDTPQIIRTYLDQFDPNFIGVQADVALLEPLFIEYGMSISVPPPGSTPMPHSMDHGTGGLGMHTVGLDGGYLVDHTAYSYLVDKEGSLRVIFGFDTSIELMMAEIQRVLAEDE